MLKGIENMQENFAMIKITSHKEYFVDKRPSIGGHFPVRNALNDVTQHQILHVLLFQGLISHNCPPRAGQLCNKIC